MITHPPRKGFTLTQALAVARELGIDFEEEGFAPEALRRGMEVELEHGRCDPRTDVTGDDPALTGKLAWAHLREDPDAYGHVTIVRLGA